MTPQDQGAEGLPEQTGARGGVPRYRQIEAILRDQIFSGELSAGEQVPTEEELAAMYKVSRPTVRQALAMLEADSLILREPGRGTFVNAIREEYPVRRLGLSLDDMIELRMEAQVSLYRAGVLAARGMIQDALGLEYGDEVQFFIRAYAIDGQVFGGSKVYMPAATGALLKADDLVAPSLLRVMERKAGLFAVAIDARIDAVLADARAAAVFGTPLGAPLLSVHRTARAADGTAIEHSHLLLLSHRCQVSFSETREPGGGWRIVAG